MDLHLQNKVVVISGGAGAPGSISAAFVDALVQEGAVPVMLDINSRGEKLVQQLAQDNKKSLYIPTDVTDPEACRLAILQTLEKFGRIDVLINHAGGNDNVGFDGSYEDFVASLKLNLVHFFMLTKYSLPSLKTQKGCILNIASKVALTGQGNTSGYAAAKGGVLGLTREWAVDLAQYDIRVNALLIAESWTPGYDGWIRRFPQAEEKLDQIRSRIPLGKRMTHPEELADTVMFLISERASHITGQFVHVDGGYVHLDRSSGILYP